MTYINIEKESDEESLILNESPLEILVSTLGPITNET